MTITKTLSEFELIRYVYANVCVCVCVHVYARVCIQIYASVCIRSIVAPMLAKFSSHEIRWSMPMLLSECLPLYIHI